MLAIAFGASSDAEDFVEEDTDAGEVEDTDAGEVDDADTGEVDDAETGVADGPVCASGESALYDSEEVPPDESADGTGAPLVWSVEAGRLIGTVGLVAPGVVSTLAGACLIGLFGLCVCAETGSDDKSDTKLSVKAVMFRLLNCLDLERLFLWFIGPFQAFPKLTPR